MEIQNSQLLRYIYIDYMRGNFIIIIIVGLRSIASSDHSTLTLTIVSVIVSIFVFFTIGFVCGCVCQKYKQSILALCKTQTNQPTAEHEQQNLQGLEMSENVAYGPVGGLQLHVAVN